MRLVFGTINAVTSQRGSHLNNCSTRVTRLSPTTCGVAILVSNSALAKSKMCRYRRIWRATCFPTCLETRSWFALICAQCRMSVLNSGGNATLYLSTWDRATLVDHCATTPRDGLIETRRALSDNTDFLLSNLGTGIAIVAGNGSARRISVMLWSFCE